MKSLWKEKCLGEVLCLEYGKPLDGAERKADGLYPVYGANGEKNRSDKYYFDRPSIIVGRKGSVGEVNLTEEKFWPLDVAYFVTFDPRQYELRFLYYLLTTLDLPSLGKGVKPGLNRNEAYSLVTKTPPLHEQQRIVGILDGAFAGIATAKAAAEKNLQNARALFEGHLQSVFTQRGRGWSVMPIGEVAEVFDGPHATPKTVNSGPVFLGISALQDGLINLGETRHVTAKDFYQWTRRVKPRPDDVVFSYETRLGQAAVIPSGLECCLGRRMGLVRVNRKRLDPRFFVYQYISPPFREFLHGRTVRGATVDRIALKEFSSFPIALPGLDEQKIIANRLESLRAETQRLESVYKQKLTALDALKKALLQLAFSGQMTGQSLRTSKLARTTWPVELPGIATTDLHAGILAMAHELHDQAHRLDAFGHVKAEKIAHMVEAHLGISLGRQPIKDVAGPNDFPHLRKVEHRARKANYFDFAQTKKGPYRVLKLRGLNRLLAKTREALGDRHDEVERLLNWMLPMTTQQAEIAATVFAAWNNLLLDGKQPTDEEIVREAREDWHPDKLKIERERFLTAVGWLRDKGIVPEGKGKRVSKKAG